MGKYKNINFITEHLFYATEEEADCLKQISRLLWGEPHDPSPYKTMEIIADRIYFYTQIKAIGVYHATPRTSQMLHTLAAALNAKREGGHK